jgi:hypothetical protein
VKLITFKEIQSWNPCYCPSKYLQENWKGTALDILKMKEVPFRDRLWVVLREELLSDKLMRLFAVWCARQVQHLMKDERSIAALDVAERYAIGKAREEELRPARAAARAAAGAAAGAAAWAAARAAARDAARDAAWAAQEEKLIEMIVAGIETGDTK